MGRTEKFPQLENKVISGGRLSLKNIFTDTTPPAAVTDLSVHRTTNRSITLRWKATGDDNTIGQAYEYELRYAQNPISAENFQQATRATGVSEPGEFGQLETYTLLGLQEATPLYFALIVKDEVYNESALSNVVFAQTDSPDNVYFFDDFSSSLSSWTNQGMIGGVPGSLWHIDEWVVIRVQSPDLCGAVQGYLPSGEIGELNPALYYGQFPEFNFETVVNGTPVANSGAVSFEVDLSAAPDGEKIELIFDMMLEQQTTGLPPRDILDINFIAEFEDDGVVTEVVTLIKRYRKQEILEFVNVRLDLEAALFEEAVSTRIEFVFDTVNAGANNFLGAVIDNVRVSGYTNRHAGNLDSIGTPVSQVSLTLQ